MICSSRYIAKANLKLGESPTLGEPRGGGGNAGVAQQLDQVRGAAQVGQRGEPETRLGAVV